MSSTGWIGEAARFCVGLVTEYSPDYLLSERIARAKEGSAQRKHLEYLVDCYRCLWVAFFVTALCMLPEQGPRILYFVSCAAGIRIAEILATGIRLFLLPEGTFFEASYHRSTLIAMFSILSLVLGYAVLFLASGGVHFNGSEPVALANGLDAVYFSTVTMLTVGYGDFVPTTPVARTLVIVEIGSGLLMLAEIVPYLVAHIETPRAESVHASGSRSPTARTDPGSSLEIPPFRPEA